jgi:hypothetical protein
MSFDIEGVCVASSELACRDALRARAGCVNGPIERHSVRVFLIMEELARQVRIPLDREVSLCAALLHDAGLYDPAGRPRLYLTRGRVSATRLIDPFEWPAEKKRRCLDAIEFHHRLRPQWRLGNEVELLRLADLVDANRGLARFGLSRNWLDNLFRSIERKGLQRELLRHSVRGAPCLSRGIAGTLLNALRRTVPEPG